MQRKSREREKAKRWEGWIVDSGQENRSRNSLETRQTPRLVRVAPLFRPHAALAVWSEKRCSQYRWQASISETVEKISNNGRRLFSRTAMKFSLPELQRKSARKEVIAVIKVYAALATYDY